MQLCKIQIRQLRDALQLIEEVFNEFDAPNYTEIGIKTFLHYISYQNMLEMIEKKEMLLYGAYEGNELIGVIALRGDQHLSLLFVKKEYHRRGVARKLFRMVVAVCMEKELEKNVITVNASPYAVEAYKRLGFAKITGEQEKDGIRFTPMFYQMVKRP